MEKLTLLGDEAVALGALHAGLGAAYGYPGTPSTEIMDYLLDHAEGFGAKAGWCVNEKTALEQALGASLAGRRAIVTMKHVGLNVAADPFMNAAMVKINGGLVVAVADDPGMHSSQDEQDSRFYADFARVTCLEPSTHQEAYDMAREAFEISERFHIPVVLKLVTRLAHSRAVVKVGKPEKVRELGKMQDRSYWIVMPQNARRRWGEVIQHFPKLVETSEKSRFNRLSLADAEFGVITTGLAGPYYLENESDLPKRPSHLHIGEYPIPVGLVRKLAAHCKKILLLEEGYPYVERYLRGLLPQALVIQGKESGEVPAQGELNPEIVRRALGLPARAAAVAQAGPLPGRPPQLCQGCPHIDSYMALKQALEAYPAEKSVVTSDIGCYTLGALAPYNVVESTVCMGASIGMAKGAAEAGMHPVVATIGDSTFLHSGLANLIDAVAANTPMTVMILDNETVGMTGGQQTALPSSRVWQVLQGLGIDPEHLHRIVPLRNKAEENLAIVKREVEYQGLSVIVAQRECLETLKRKRGSKS